MDVYRAMIEAGALTANEVRILEGLNELWNPVVVEHGMTIERVGGNKIACTYCSRPNHYENELCGSCGAPLPI